MEPTIDDYPGRVIDHATLDRMHAAVLAILARTGFWIEHAELRAELLRHDGIVERNGRVCLEPRFVEDYVAWHRGRHRITAPGPLRFGTNSRPAWIAAGGGVRPMLREDVVAGAKLIEVLRQTRGLIGDTPGMPQDVPVALQPLAQYLIGAEYSSAGGATEQVTNIAMAEFVRAMDRVYGRPCALSVYFISPLRFVGTELDILWHFRHEVASICAGSMPMMGLTGPCDPLSVFTLAVAETVGAAALLHAVFPAADVSFYPHPEPADLATGAIVFGTPEWQLLDMMHRDVLQYYGLPYHGRMCHTTAPTPNAQAQVERATAILLGVLHGYEWISPLGQLSNDEVWSPAQLLLDLETIDYAQRLARGAASAPELSLDKLPGIIDEVVQQGMLFAEHESTLAVMRRQYQHPRLFRRGAVTSWLAAGSPDLIHEAERQAEKLIGQYDYTPPAEVLRELRAIYQRAKDALG